MTDSDFLLKQFIKESFSASYLAQKHKPEEVADKVAGYIVGEHGNSLKDKKPEELMNVVKKAMEHYGAQLLDNWQLISIRSLSNLAAKGLLKYPMARAVGSLIAKSSNFRNG